MNLSQLKVALYTLVHKEIRRFMRIWPQTLLPPAIVSAESHQNSPATWLPRSLQSGLSTGLWTTR